MDDVNPVFLKEAWEERVGGRFLNYVGPNVKSNFSLASIRKLMREKHAMGARWNYDWDCGEEGPWYAYVCDTPNYELSSIKKKVRYYVRRGLNVCEIRDIDPAWLATNGYSTYVNAASRYRNVTIQAPEAFSRHILRVGGKPGYVMWGVFVGNDLAAYGIVRIWDRLVQFCVAKFDPAFSESYPMYAMYYTIVHEYLGNRGCDIVDNGTRPLYHDTAIGDFLLRMGWRKAYCRFGLYLTPMLRAALLTVRPFRGICRRWPALPYGGMLETLLLAEDLARLTRK